uniref:LIX1-like protein n=1 Tax=Lygus hesperus TaxID=30085 RepID=A0A0A9WQB9_LYGHE
MSSGSDDELDTQQPQGLTQAANTGLMDFIANEVRLNPMVLSKSQLPHVKRKKDEAVENIIKKHENHFGRRIEISRLMKKINNMKTRLKKKTDWSKTGNKRIKLQNWEKLLYEAMEGNVNPCVSQMPGGLACGVANTSSASESPTLISESISTASSDTSMHSSQLIMESITSPVQMSRQRRPVYCLEGTSTISMKLQKQSR